MSNVVSILVLIAVSEKNDSSTIEMDIGLHVRDPCLASLQPIFDI